MDSHWLVRKGVVVLSKREAQRTDGHSQISRPAIFAMRVPSPAGRKEGAEGHHKAFSGAVFGGSVTSAVLPRLV